MVRPSSWALWFGALAGPVAFLIDLQIEYAIIEYACANHANWIFWLTTLVSLLVAIGGVVIAFPYTASGDKRIHFMAWSGVAISAMFSLAIIAMAIPQIFLKACD